MTGKMSLRVSMTTSPDPSDALVLPIERATQQPFVPPSRRTRTWLTLLILLFFGFHGLLSLRSAVLRDDRYGWRMFPNVGFYRIEYAWITNEGERRGFVPTKQEVVTRGHRLIIPRTRRRWRDVWYSDGMVRVIIDGYAKHMGETRRPSWASAFEARLQLRINDETTHTEHVYRYPKEIP